TINITQKNTFLQCSVQDNGVGKKSSDSVSASGNKHNGYGISLTEDRINLYRNTRIKEPFIRFKDVIDVSGAPGGTEVIIKIPYKQVLNNPTENQKHETTHN
ncbi:MAG: hypothetical protein ACPF9D_08720, partial [Owenweeksia sp.]